MGYAIDTAKAQADFEEAGMPAPQAKAVVSAIAASGGEAVTREYLDAKLTALEARLSLKTYLMAGAVVGLLKALEYLGA